MVTDRTIQGGPVRRGNMIPPSRQRWEVDDSRNSPQANGDKAYLSLLSPPLFQTDCLKNDAYNALASVPSGVCFGAPEPKSLHCYLARRSCECMFLGLPLQFPSGGTKGEPLVRCLEKMHLERKGQGLLLHQKLVSLLVSF
jgi:hypothetical protein